MYNPLKNKMRTYFFENHVKDSYKKVLDIENKEEIYYHKNKLVILVKDEEIGERIFEIVKNLKNKTISTEHTSFKISKYVADKTEKIQLFYIDFTFKETWNYSSKLELLQEFTSFVSKMQEIGYIIDESVFKKEECNCISSLLSFFVQNKEKVEEDINGLLINFIHYVLTNGGELNEDYQKICEKGYCSTSELFYNLSIARMCYEYYLNGIYENSIFWNLVEASMEESVENQFYSYILFDRAKFEANSNLVKKDDRYAVYDGNIKIYDQVSHEFEDFLKVKCKHYLENNIGSIEEVDEIIVDLDEKIVGYKFSTSKSTEFASSINNQNFDSQYDLFNHIVELSKYLKRINNSGTRNEENDFDIEKCIRSDGTLKHQFRVGEIQDFFDLLNYDVNLLENQITLIFFKLYLKYIQVKYGIKYSDEDFLNIIEVRYLSPILAREFINFALEKDVDLDSATADFESFFSNLMHTTHPNIAGPTYYDSKFEYDPVEVPFTFDYEIEKKYGVKYQKGTFATLPDGRRLEIFSRCRDISKVKESQTLLKSDIDNKFSISSGNEKFKFVSISEIIYSKVIDASGRYKMIGFISEPVKGIPVLSYLKAPERSNRDFLKIAAYLFKEFEYYNISLEEIYVHDDLDEDSDEDLVFYINLVNNPSIKKTSCYYFANSFVNYMAEVLMNEHTVSSHLFIDLELSCNYSKRELISLIESFDSYCNEHNVYYSSNKTFCPICLKTKTPVDTSFLNEDNKIFEDEYAIHYRLNWNYNIKIYKETNSEKLSEFGRNVDFIINNSDRISWNQNCFIPVKKAVDETTKKFIGYIYIAYNFQENHESSDNLCVNLGDLQKLNNLNRIKCLIRLVEQIRDLTERGFGFIENPFGNVFRVKSQKRQVQILNIDFVRKHENIQNTEKWVCEYVGKIIALDENINCNIHGFQTNYNHVLSKLVKLTDALTKKCSYHKMYYDNKYLFCPKCIDPKLLLTVDICRAQRSDIRSLNKFNEGGESYIYTYSDTTVAKVFKDPSDPEFQNQKNKDCIDLDLKRRVMAAIMKKRHILEKINRNKKLKFKYIIPKRIFVDETKNEIFGYVMDKIENASQISILKDKTQVEKLGLLRKDIFEILITIGQGIETLHKEANIYIGDLNGRNILFDTDKNVYFLDFDGMGIDDIMPEFCTEGYIDPISKRNNNITMKDDWYSFAIQAFHYLTYTHPFNGIYELNGKTLEITEKMENRISLLGNHGIQPPKIAIPWDDWMIPELKRMFLEIFEGTTRESIVPYLIKQYESFVWDDSGEPMEIVNFSNEENNLEKQIITQAKEKAITAVNTVRINPKFVATIINPFEFEAIKNSGKIVKVINENAAVYDDNGTLYVTINKNGKSWYYIPLPSCLDIKNILVTENDKFAVVVYEDYLIGIDLTTNVEIFQEPISNSNNVVINNSTLYFTQISESGEKQIIQLNIYDNGDNTKNIISFMTDVETKGLSVRHNSKFIVVKESQHSSNIDEIYCNSQKLCSIRYTNGNYKIVYDEFTKKWLVVNNENIGIVLNSRDGSFEYFSIEGDINYKAENITFNKGNIYIPSDDSLYILCSNNQFNTKMMECANIVTPDSRVYNINKDGFSIITNNNIYEIRRG